MTKVVIVNHGTRMNKGGAALLNSRIKALKEFIPDAEFTVFTYDLDYEPEMKYLQDINIKFYEVIFKLSPRGVFKTSASIFKLFLYRIGLNTKPNEKSGIQEYSNTDVIISTGGDRLTEDYSPFGLFKNSINLSFGILVNKPVVLYAESIGPFNKWWNKIIGKVIFNKMCLIILREEISRKHLKQLSINKPPIYVTADSAFLLKPAPQQIIKEIMLKEGINETNKPLIGMSVSKIIARYGFSDLKDNEEKYNKYIDLMSKVVDYWTEKLNATVIFVPHVIRPRGNDDRTVADDIIDLIKNKHECIPIKKEYTTEELKGIIGECDLFIGARMHATIASTSMLVPTVGIAYSHKMHGIIGEMLGQERCILDIKELNYESLISKINDAWENREKIRKELEMKIPIIRERAMLNGKLVKELLDSLKMSCNEERK